MAAPANQALLRQLRARLGGASGPTKPKWGIRTLSKWAASHAEGAREDVDFIWVCSLSCSLCVLGIILDEEVNHIRNTKAKAAAAAAHVAQAVPESRPTSC